MRILAIDQGTSATKAIVVRDGVVESLAELPVHPTFGPDGAVEQDPSELLASVLEAGGEALAEAGGRVDGVALANQGETVLAWDPATGHPLTTALVWQDSRAQEVCDDLAAHADLITARTGLVLDPYFSAPKMAWLRRHRTRDGVVTTTDTWLIHQLTGAFVTDVTTASRSLVLDVDRIAWDDELLDLFGLGDERMPELVDCDAPIGAVAAFDAPLVGLAVDQQAALLAESCLGIGDAKCTYGTGAFLLANCGARAVRSTAGLTTSVAWRAGCETRYCLDGQVFTAASAIRWLHELGVLDDARSLDDAVAEDSGDVRFSPALAGLGAPWWRSDARGAFTGLGLSTTRGEIIRAVLEGIAAQVAELARVMGEDIGMIRRLRVDGGLTHSRALLQIQADLLQAPIEVYPSAHATPLGVAALGRLALDPSLTIDEVAAGWEPALTVEPTWSVDRAAEFMASWRGAVERTSA